MCTEYDVCVTCYNSKGPDDFRYPKNKLRKQHVPESQRMTYWKNDAGDVSLSKPISLTPLNPDAYALKNDSAGVEELKQASTFLEACYTYTLKVVVV